VQLHHCNLLGALGADRIEIDIGVVREDRAAQAPDDALAADATFGATIIRGERSADPDALRDP
jgi:hypothetical protein